MEDRRLRIGLVQHAVTGDTGYNLEKTLSLASEAADRGAEIICLPELFRTPYFPQYEGRDATPFAEPVPGESTEAFSVLSRECRVAIIVPVFERGTDGRFFNTAVLIDKGRILEPPYRKVHIPHDPLFFEKGYFSPGSGYAVYATPAARIGVLICYDQWFPEAARALTLLGAEIIFYPTAIGWIRGERDTAEGDWRNAWETVQRGHAIANGVHVAAVNRAGTEGDLVFWGSSFVADAFGTVTARAGEGEQVLLADIDPGMNNEVREGWGFLRNRRPDTYHILAREG
ncbi:MAG: carbon-nitrogen hydrolase [Methanomicrobiales archaeon]|nr:carbon-nitrogen hydrolase [Methanomicrobiales archaeon]NYT20697.1 carbon-nitrogen hydrolase [Methanomicrobiales archaeon]